MTFVVATFIGALIGVPLVPPGWPRVAYMLTLGSYAACAVVWERRRRLRLAMARLDRAFMRFARAGYGPFPYWYVVDGAVYEFRNGHAILTDWTAW